MRALRMVPQLSTPPPDPTLPCCHPVPTGDTCESVARLLRGQLDAFMQDGPSARELARVKKATRAGLLAGVQSNSSMAAALCAYHALTGGWRGIVEELEVRAWREGGGGGAGGVEGRGLVSAPTHANTAGLRG